MTVPAWAAAYVGIAYRDRGLDLQGCNCWGLVRLVLAQQCGVELPTYVDHIANPAKAMVEAIKQSSPWLVVVDKPKSFDVVHMTSYPIVNGRRIRTEGHCGIMISPERVLHVWEESPPYSVHVSIDHHRIKPRILGFYRHEALA